MDTNVSQAASAAELLVPVATTKYNKYLELIHATDRHCVWPEDYNTDLSGRNWIIIVIIFQQNIIRLPANVTNDSQASSNHLLPLHSQHRHEHALTMKSEQSSTHAKISSHTCRVFRIPHSELARRTQQRYSFNHILNTSVLWWQN